VRERANPRIQHVGFELPRRLSAAARRRGDRLRAARRPHIAIMSAARIPFKGDARSTRGTGSLYLYHSVCEYIHIYIYIHICIYMCVCMYVYM